jgi:hypothetical protein
MLTERNIMLLTILFFYFKKKVLTFLFSLLTKQCKWPKFKHTTCSGTPKKFHITWESKLRIVNIQYPHSSTRRGAFYKDKTVRAHMQSKTNNTSEHGVTYLRVKWNIDPKRRGIHYISFSPLVSTLNWSATISVHLKSPTSFEWLRIVYIQHSLLNLMRYLLQKIKL